MATVRFIHQIGRRKFWARGWADGCVARRSDRTISVRRVAQMVQTRRQLREAANAVAAAAAAASVPICRKRRFRCGGRLSLKRKRNSDPHQVVLRIPRDKPAIPVPRLANLGCSCFANAVLQLLFHAPGFCSALKASRARRVACPHKPTACLIDALSELMSSMARGVGGPPLEPERVVFLARRHFQDVPELLMQQDAQEFLSWLLANVERAGALSSDATSALFIGEMRSSTTCLRCEDVSTSTERFHELNLSVAASDASLRDAIVRFERSEHLCGECKFMCCGSCHGALSEARRRLSFVALPRLLLLHLKTGANSGCEVPRELTVRSIGHAGAVHLLAQFTLVGAVMLRSFAGACDGHYHAVVKPRDKAEWVVVDDDHATTLSEADLDRHLCCGPALPYILLYCRN